jgi:hypothetical protein
VLRRLPVHADIARGTGRIDFLPMRLRALVLG